MPTEKSNSKLKYLAPSSDNWTDLIIDVPPEATDEMKAKIKFDLTSANSMIKDMLLASLQMQNLIVLSGSGTSLGPIIQGPSMADLWKATEKIVATEEEIIERKDIVKEIKFNSKSTNIEELLSQCEAYLQIKNEDLVKKYYDGSKKVILEKCSFEITPEKIAAHVTFLHRLSRRRVRDSRLKLFTSNYDLCFETAAGELGLIILDGFSFSLPRKYDPRYFSYDIVRRPLNIESSGNYLEGVFQLYKLHGSVNWERSIDGKEILVKSNPEPERTCIVYPAKGKYQQSYIQPHLELMAQYLSSLREPNTCLLVCGFGLNDDHLTLPILSAVKTNPYLRLVVIDSKSEEKIKVGDNPYWTELKELAKSGEDIWFINSSFQEFANLIPDLKSLTPPEKLQNIIKSIAGKTQ